MTFGSLEQSALVGTFTSVMCVDQQLSLQLTHLMMSMVRFFFCILMIDIHLLSNLEIRNQPSTSQLEDICKSICDSVQDQFWTEDTKIWISESGLLLLLRTLGKCVFMNNICYFQEIFQLLFFTDRVLLILIILKSQRKKR